MFVLKVGTRNCDQDNDKSPKHFERSNFPILKDFDTQRPMVCLDLRFISVYNLCKNKKMCTISKAIYLFG